jgi:uncharacterized protein YukE
MKQKEKETAIDKFLTTKRKGHMLEIDLSFKGMDDEAQRVKDKNAELSEKVDDLLNNIMQDWVGDTTSGVAAELTKINGKIQRTIRDIKKDIEVAKNIVKAVKHLDDAINYAMKLLA